MESIQMSVFEIHRSQDYEMENWREKKIIFHTKY